MLRMKKGLNELLFEITSISIFESLAYFSSLVQAMGIVMGYIFIPIASEDMGWIDTRRFLIAIFILIAELSFVILYTYRKKNGSIHSRLVLGAFLFTCLFIPLYPIASMLKFKILGCVVFLASPYLELHLRKMIQANGENTSDLLKNMLP